MCILFLFFHTAYSCIGGVDLVGLKPNH